MRALDVSSARTFTLSLLRGAVATSPDPSTDEAFIHDPLSRPTRRQHDGMPFIEHAGFTRSPFTDVYHLVIGMSWTRFMVSATVLYVLFNATFATLYMLGGDCYAADDPDSFLQAFAFSVQTMSGIGYGAMSPTTPYANVVSILEAFLGLLGVAMTTGLVFAKFSRPVARVGFADVAIVNERDGQPVLQLRMSNERRNQVVDARAQLVALIEHRTREGDRMRRVVDLWLERDQTPVFRMSWTLLHPLDEDSPLHGLTAENAHRRMVGLIVNFTGLDDTFSQTVHAQRVYTPDEIRFGVHYRDMIVTREDGTLVVHHDRLHDIREPS
jgi:inward rectifier potassium channel